MWSEKHLRQLEQEGFIRGYIDSKKELPAVKVPQNKPGSKIKGWLSLNLKVWADSKGLELVTEYKFHSERKWRFDWYLPGLQTGIEYEGLMSSKSRHTTISGYTGDAEKYGQAAIMGIKVLRYTAKNYKNILKDLEQLINTK